MKLVNTEWNGKKITKPGMYSLIGIDIYHSQALFDGPSVSSSGLRRLDPSRGSPAHFFAEWDGNPEREEDNELKRQFILGRALHHLMLGEPFFAKLFAVEPEEYKDPDKGNEWKPWSNNATICKQWNAQQTKAGRIILKNKEVTVIRKMAAKLGLHPFVQAGALNGLIERSIFWKDKKTGIWCKARPDSIPTASADFVDYKSTTSVLWEEIQRTINKFGYHQQAAMVRQACREVMGLDTTQTQFTFTLLFQEKKAPFCVRDVQIKGIAMDLGERQNRHALDTMAQCLKTGFWPGPGYGREGTDAVEPSAWRTEQIEHALKYDQDVALGRDAT